MRVCLMVEGQEGVSWEQWVALALAAEESGLEALFRSDHYLSFGHPRERVALDAWTTIAGLAAVTERVKLGTMVSPATFRHPSNLAKSVATADHISGGRVELGLGAGWNEAEHRAYGFPFPPTAVRMEMFAEQAEIIHRSWNDDVFDFKGKHYTIESLAALPKPTPPHPNFIVGGRAAPKSVAVAARWADEYNVNFANLETCRRRRERVDEAWEAAGRGEPPVFSLMTGCIVGRDRDDLMGGATHVIDQAGNSGDPAAFLEGLPEPFIRGTVEEVADQLRALEGAGVERVMMQLQAHDDVEMVHVLGEVAQLIG